MKKRWLSLLTGLTLCLVLAPTATAAERRPQGLRLPEVELVLEEEDGLWDGEVADLLAQPDYEGAVQALRQEIVQRADTIRIDQYHIPATPDALDRLMQGVFYRYGELFALDSGPSSQSWSCSILGGVIYEVRPAYRQDMDPESYAQAKDFYDQALTAIVDQVPPGLSDAEKVLFVHDYLAANYEYDYDYAIYDAYGFLKEGKGVCQAYMLTFSALMDRLGIPVSYVESNLLNHVWNVVELDGTWYHVDVTWDDPGVPTAPDSQGYQRYTDVAGGASHSYFLLSDQTNEALRRDWAEGSGLEYVNDQRWGQEVTCPDDAYETGPWAQADSPVVYVPGTGSWYYLSTGLSDQGLYRWSGEPDQDPVRMGDYSTAYYNGIAPLVEHRGCLFFADPGQVNRWELATGTVDVLVSADGEAHAYSGLRLREGQLSVKDRLSQLFTPFEGQLLPWREVDAGLLSYYYDFGQVELRLGEDARDKRLLLAWYDGATGQMTGLDHVAADGFFGRGVADKELECSLFILCEDGTWAPARPKLPLKPQLELDR